MSPKWSPAADEDIDVEHEQAVLRAREADRFEPRADFVLYDRDRGLIVVELKNGFGVCFPPDRVPGLAGASATELEKVEISPSGDGLQWHALDVHASLTGLVIEGLGLRKWVPRLMGQFKSTSKAKAARINGRKGGRPSKQSSLQTRWAQMRPSLLQIKGVGPKSLQRIESAYGGINDLQKVDADEIRRITRTHRDAAEKLTAAIRKAGGGAPSVPSERRRRTA